jgi:hypothetical protein
VLTDPGGGGHFGALFQVRVPAQAGTTPPRGGGSAQAKNPAPGRTTRKTPENPEKAQNGPKSSKIGRFGHVGHVLALFMARYHVSMHFGWVLEPACP